MKNSTICRSIRRGPFCSAQSEENTKKNGEGSHSEQMTTYLWLSWTDHGFIGRLDPSVRHPLRVWTKFSRPDSLHLAAGWLQFLWVFWTLWPSLQETSEERPNNVIPSPKMAEKAWECSSAVSSALVSPCLHLCNRGWPEWTEDDFLCDSGYGVTEPTLLSDDQLSQTLHCARPPPAHHSFHFLLFCLCWGGKNAPPTRCRFIIHRSRNDYAKVSVSRTLLHSPEAELHNGDRGRVRE